MLKYTVPADAPIELWDSAIRVRAKGGDTIDAVASRYGVPGWAIAQINSLDQDHPLEVGQELIVPRSIYSEAALQEPVAAVASKTAAAHDFCQFNKTGTKRPRTSGDNRTTAAASRGYLQ